MIAEDTSGSTFLTTGDGTALTAAYRQTGDRLYLGVEEQGFRRFVWTMTVFNTAATRFKAEYYNGTSWQYLPAKMFAAESLTNEAPWGTVKTETTNLFAQGSLNSANAFFCASPADWTTTSVNSVTAYWARLTYLDAALDAAVDPTTSNALGLVDPGTIGFFEVQYTRERRYYGLTTYSTTTNPDVVVVFDAEFPDMVEDRQYSDVARTQPEQEPATLAVVPQFAESFVAYDHKVLTFRPLGLNILNKHDAVPETRDFAVGSIGGEKSPYHPDYVASDAAFPKAKYISFFKGRLWAAGLLDDPFTVQWSAPQPYHKVWPSLSKEPLMEDDNSPITGMMPLGEYMVIFKQDSIWVAYDAGINAFGLQTYAIRRIVAGIGCVANSSIQQIRGNLIFLAEDGIYAFDGTPQIQKLSDKVSSTLETIDAGARSFCSSVNWKTKSCYILSFSAKGAGSNNTTFVFDYKNNSWWKWAAIEARFWLRSEGSNDQEIIYFMDDNGQVFELGGAKTDNGAAISANITTQRLGYGSGTRVRGRDITLTCDNKAGASVTAELLVTDESSGASATFDFTDTTYEKPWSDFDWTAGDSNDDNWSYVRRRQQRAAFRRDGDWLQVKVAHSTKNQPFRLALIDLGYISFGDR
jgi:hypothetical protein